MKQRGLSGISAWIVVAAAFSGLLGFEAEGLDGAFGGGDGTPGNPFIIEDVLDLQNMTGNLSAHYVLKNDIDATGTAGWNDGAGFAPIGEEENGFIGSLDGNNHTIKGLFIDRAGQAVGLFGCIGSEGLVRNLGIVGCDINGSYPVGCLAGQSYGTVINSYSTGNVTGQFSVGGLVGYNDGEGIINGSYSSANVVGEYVATGGLVGDNSGTITGSYAMGSVDGQNDVGGLAGENSGMVIDSHATGSVTGSAMYAGGLVGINRQVVNDSYATGDVSGNQGVGGLFGENSGPVANSYSSGNVTGTGERVGGLAGTNMDVLNRTHASGNVTGAMAYVGGLVGINMGTINNSYSMGNVNGGMGYVGGLVGSDFYAILRNSHYNVEKVLIKGGHSITAGGLYDAQFWDWLSGGLSLDIADYGATLVGTGDHFEISGVDGLKDLIGFSGEPGLSFRLAADIDLSQAPGLYIPCLASDFDGDNHTISNLRLNLSYAAPVGLFGKIDGGAARNTILSSVFVRGFSLVGGLVGYSYRGLVDHSSAEGTVIGSMNTGGLVGQNRLGSVYDSFSRANVTGVSAVGGLVGNNGGTVNDSYAIGNVTGTSDYVGGFVGKNDKLVERAYCAGSVSWPGPNVGGFAGANSGTISASFWDNDVCSLTKSFGGTASTTAQMKTRSTFTGAGWDFSEVWCMVEKVTYPFLRWQDTESPRADAGPDQTIDEGSTVTFNGSASTDDCGIGNYTWSFSDKAPVELYGIRPAYIFDDPGVFNVTLTVTDALGRLGADSMIVTVGDETDPVPVAGPDQTVDEGSVVAFNGSGSLDNVGIINYTWSFMDPAPVELYGLVATYRFENPGTFPVSLKATDAAGNWAADTLTVTVNDITSPVADAGPDRVVGVGEVLTFNGSASTDNVGIVKYGWTFADGGLVVLSGAKPSHTFKNPGTFLVTLNVTDAAGLWGTDTMTVSVNDTTAPVANAGPDRTVDETVEAVFNGSGSSDNVGVVNFIWNFEDGTAVTLQGMTCQYKFSRPGTFVVTLRVFDAAGNWAEDNMTVTVNDRTPPVANAGPDITVGEGTTVVFNGSGSSDNVGIVRFSWTFSYNNGPVILTGASPSYTFVIPGVYPVKLNVSDASGFSSVDAMVLLVRDTKPPVAEAGPDQKVAAGTMVVFSGSHSTDNWGIELYFWNFTYDGKPQSLGNETNFFRFDKEGVYEIVLTVVDRDGNRAEDRFTVTVTPAGNVFGIAPPVMTLIVLAIIAVAAVCVLAFLKMRKKRSGGAEIN